MRHKTITKVTSMAAGLAMAAGVVSGVWYISEKGNYNTRQYIPCTRTVTSNSITSYDHNPQYKDVCLPSSTKPAVQKPKKHAAICPNHTFKLGSETQLTKDEVVSCLRDAGFKRGTLYEMVKIAYIESTYKPGVKSDMGAYGLLQIDDPYLGAKTGHGKIAIKDALNPYIESRFAYVVVSNHGTKFRDWTEWEPGHWETKGKSH